MDEKQQQITNQFKQMVISWVEIDDQIRSINAKMKDLKTEKKEYEEKILDYLGSINENVIEITDGKLRRNVSKTKAALKQETIQTALEECVKDVEKASQMTHFILSKRPVVERINLKRTKNRGTSQ